MAEQKSEIFSLPLLKNLVFVLYESSEKLTIFRYFHTKHLLKGKIPAP
jgi:hypothetical protein